MTSGASYASIFPTPFDGSIVAPSETFSGKEIELSAEIQPQPEITSISPPSGSVTGGTAGDDHRHQPRRRDVGQIRQPLRRRASRSTPTPKSPPPLRPASNRAKSTSPRPPSPGRTSTPGSTTSSTRPAWCRALKNKTLSKAKTLLRRNGCKLGHVKKVEAPKPKKVGKVLKQAPKAGKVLPPARGCASTLGRGGSPLRTESDRRRGAWPSRRRTPRR